MCSSLVSRPRAGSSRRSRCAPTPSYSRTRASSSGPCARASTATLRGGSWRASSGRTPPTSRGSPSTPACASSHPPRATASSSSGRGGRRCHRSPTVRPPPPWCRSRPRRPTAMWRSGRAAPLATTARARRARWPSRWTAP
eukprot:scaffold9531_cov48-Phaeocystis_antarctica.AAC.1